MDPKDIQTGHKISIIVEKLDFSSEIKHVRDGYILIELIVVNEKIVNFPDNVNANMVYFDDDDKLCQNCDSSFISAKCNRNAVISPESGHYRNFNIPFNIYNVSGAESGKTAGL